MGSMRKISDILAETGGCIYFVEQILEILSLVFPMKETELIRKMMLKRKTKKLIPFRNAFVEKLGHQYENAEELWNVLEKESRYAFNRSHMIAYQNILESRKNHFSCQDKSKYDLLVRQIAEVAEEKLNHWRLPFKADEPIILYKEK